MTAKKAPTVTTIRLPTNQTLVIAHAVFRVSGPQGSYSSVEYGYNLANIVDGDDDFVVESAAESLDALGDQMAEKRRDAAYRELVKHLKAIDEQTWREEPDR